jgi:hypothetical protein
LDKEKISEIDSVETSIKSLIDCFSSNPYIFWREFDVKCLLYHFLFLKNNLVRQFKTKNDEKTFLIHTEYKTKLGGRFDIAVFDPNTVGHFSFDNQKLVCGIEIGFDRGSSHFSDDFVRKFMKETQIPVDFGYIIHLMRDKLSYWENTVQDIKNLMPSNSEFLIEPTKVAGCGFLVVKIRIAEQNEL